MPQVDVEWPSEDEDFDAVAGSASKSRKSAAVKDAPSVSEEVTEPTLSEESTPEEPAPAENEPEVADEPEAEAAPEAQPEPVTPAEVEAPAPAVAETPAAPKVPKAPKAPKNNKSMLRLVGEVVLVVAVILLGLWAWNLSSENKDLKKQNADLNANPQAAVQKQTAALITQVSKLIQLPTGETPTIANVTDAAQAKQQSAFFNNAQNGDKVLMYVKAGEAILYRPSTNKIVLVAPLTFTSNSSSTTPSSTTTKTTTTKP